MPLYRGSRRLILRRAGGGAAPFVLEAGSVKTANTGAGTSVSITGVTTVYANCRVYVAMACNGGAPGTPTASGVTFAFRASNLSGATTIALYEGLAASPLSNVTVTAPQASSNFMTATVFAFSGGKASTPYDSNASVPLASTANPTITNNNPNDILIVAGVTNTAIDAPFIDPDVSAVSRGNFLACGYQIVSSPSTYNPVWGGSAAINSAVDAIVKGP